MEENETHSDNRHTFGHEDIDALEEQNEDQFPRPGRDLRAHLYKYILGLIVLVVLVLGAVLYLLNPFGEHGRKMPTERLGAVQMSPEEETPPTDAAMTGGKEEAVTETPGNAAGEPPAKYISMEDKDESKPTVPEEPAADQTTASAAPEESEAAQPEGTEPSEAAVPEVPEPETRAATVAEPPQAAPPAKEMSMSPKPEPATVPEEREKPVPETRARVESKAPEKKPVPETRVSKAEPSPPPEIPPMPLWYVQVGAFTEKSNSENLRQQLVKAGFPTSITWAQRGGRVLYITRVGPYPSRVKAEIGAEKLRKEGQQAIVLQLKK